MRIKKSSPVVVCVTAQRDCEQMIRLGAERAKAEKKPLQILTVCPTTEINLETAEVLEHLYQTAKKFRGEMITYFNDNPVLTAAAYLSQAHASRIVAGVPGDNTNDFINVIHMLVPHIPITVFSRHDQTEFEIAAQLIPEAPLRASCKQAVAR